MNGVEPKTSVLQTRRIVSWTNFGVTKKNGWKQKDNGLNKSATSPPAVRGSVQLFDSIQAQNSPD